MKQRDSKNWSFCWTWLKAVVMMVLLLSGWTSEASACTLEDTWRYTVNLEGTDKLRLKMPLYCKDGYDCWVVEGYVYITPEGGSKETLFYYKSQQDIDNSDYYPRIYPKKGVDGSMRLFRDRGYSTVNIGNTEGNELCPCVDNQEYAIVNLLWDIPNKYRGKKVTISWSIHHNGNVSEPDKYISIDQTVISIPAAPDLQYPSLMTPIVSYDASRPNQIMVPYMMPASNIQSMEAKYTEVRGNKETSKSLTLAASTSGYIYMPAEANIKDFNIEATYIDSEKKTQTTKSSSIDLPVLHQPKHMSAVMQPNGKVVISWGVGYRNCSEITSTDTWEVQRNVTGDPTNNEWTTLRQENYDEKIDEYSCDDETLLSVYQGKDVYYRVRRTITAVWNWSSQSGYAMTKLAGTLALPSIRKAFVKRDGTWNDASHGVNLDFTIGSRDVSDANGRFVIHDVKDWKDFASAVNGGQTTLNAILASDIDLGTESFPMVGTSSQRYAGTFDGNGHTLTFNPKNTYANDYYAPFCFVGNATFKNLHTQGRLISVNKFISGLVGNVADDATLLIENCRSSVVLDASTHSGDGTNGGFVGNASRAKSVTLRNCLFDGSFLGLSTTNNGGLVGWCYNSVTIEKCLFAPSYIGTKYDGCNTWARLSDSSKLSVTGSYFIQQYNSNDKGSDAKDMLLDKLQEGLGAQWVVEGSQVVPIMNSSQEDAHKTLIWDDRAKVVLNIEKYVVASDGITFVISKENDWDDFAEAVRVSRGEYEVNCKLLTDVTVSKPLENYSGSIEGNGHTITLNLTESNLYYSLIRYGFKNITIRNLNVKGVVSGSNYCAGLIGMLGNDMANLTVENCHVSANISTSNDGYAAGFVANASSGKVTLRNCLFDGNASFTGLNSYSMFASFVNRSHRTQDMTVENCLENGTYNGYNNVVAVGYYDGNSHKAWNGGMNIWTYSTNGFSEISHVGSIASAQLAANLGSQWQVTDGKVVPRQDNGIRYTERRELTSEERDKGQLSIDLKTACVDHEFRLSVEPGMSVLPLSVDGDVLAKKYETDDKSVYKFDNNVKMGKAKADTLQNAVSLSWESTRGQADYYRIKRYDKLTPDTVVTLEDNYSQTAYMDRTVRPQHTYTYIIEGVTQCEGENVSQTTVDGCCIPTGMVRGYVRLTNGIGLPGYTVTATPVGEIDGAEILTCVTDSTGYFEIGGLVYQKYGEYTLTVTDSTHEATFRAQNVTFDEDVNLQTNIIFTQTNYYIFSGYVLYDGSSIPVSGVRFLRDGVEVVNSNGKPVTTNNQGAFEVSVPQGSHRIQVVKDGHIFKNDGFFITPDAKPDSTWHNWQKNVSEIYLWDQTKVNLQGRVVGGNEQGLLPLGESLSKNNLGDSITIVMQLEGDNTSWIVRDQKNASVTERHNAYAHGKNDTTQVDAYRHRILIHPDPKTGEYLLPMYPVKYKVTEVYAQGYPTLFQTGMVSETLDLNEYMDGDTATYSRIFHSQPTLDVWQFTGTQDRFYGLKQYTSMDNAGVRDTVYLWKDGEYSLGYPVFMGGASVPMFLSAREEYRYNNEELGELDVVQLDGGMVYVNNGLISTDDTDEIELDSVGQASYIFTPQNTTFNMDGYMALRTLKFTLQYDGSYYDIQPIRGFVMAAMPQEQGRRIIAGQNTHLVDILRDPPGASSSAYIEKGSKFSYSYSADYSVQMGVNLAVGMGGGSDYFTGVWGGIGSGTEAGTVFSSDNYTTLSYDLATTYYKDWTYEYEFEATERISTSDHEKEVGANSDVYIGMTDNVVVEDAIAVRVVNSAALNRLKPGLGGKTVVNGHEFDVKGTAKVLARGWDAVNKDSIYLIRDEVLQFSTKLNSTFVYSQDYLLDELIPGLIRTRNTLLMDSTTTASYAQTLANNTKRPVYVSKVSTNNPNFSLRNYYTMYKPAGVTDQWSDSIQALNNQIQTWAGFIAANEKEKLEARDLVKVYNFDGATSVEYSETFTTTADLHRYWKIPSTVSLTGEDGYNVDNKGGKDKKDGILNVAYEAGGVFFSLKVTPLFGFDFNYMNGYNDSYTKGTGFTLACSRNSFLDVAVYRVGDLSADSIAKLQAAGDMGIYYKKVEENLKEIYNGSKGSSNTTSYIQSLDNVKRYRNLVFRTLGGATASPWEEERKTIFYNPGTILDQATLRIDQLRIWVKEQSVSNVPYGEPARFTLYMTNESETPARVTKALKYYLEDTSNPNGAKVLIDGCPLTGSGIDLWLEPNTIVEKQVEVYAGAEYDYEDLQISLMDEDDEFHIETVSISAHFVPAAGAVNISKPGDKWVVNTESAYDNEQQAYYLPVHIDGFDINFRNFDHIELQYKLSTQGDKDWVNVCSYYPNTEEGERLMALASGKRQLMEHDGYIDAFFYGEKDPIEQYYDIRAVTFCRHGNGYLTRASNILTGIKDTRRPRLFGTPQPVDGILDIGEDIILRFSEPIAGNYLSSVNNFEVIGQTNSSNISLSSSLHFDNGALALAQASRNLAEKSFTVDVMINPADNGKKMPVVYHGESEHKMVLGLTEDRRLMASFSYDDSIPPLVYTATEPCKFDGLREVFYVIEPDVEKGTTTISFYDGSANVGSSVYPHLYEGTGSLLFGIANMEVFDDMSHYEGDMLEFRLWNRALAESEMANYAQKSLTGYELGLMDNYPLNEGEGDFSYNRTLSGSDLMLVGTAWKMPDGIAMKLDGEKGFRLNNRPFERFDHEDYSLMFWFRTADENGTLLSNGRATTELGAKSHFNFSVKEGALNLNLSGMKLETPTYLSEGSWHHVALTVNRSRNVGCLYIDQHLTNTFAVDTLGGIRGNLLAAGATYLDASTVENPISGYIDEIAMYEMALPESNIKSISDYTPTGEEMGMLAYLNFSRNERQQQNDIRLMPTGVSLRRYKDKTTGEWTTQRDTIVSESDVNRLFDRKVYAPMHDPQTLENIKFSYVADGKDLLINLDVPEASIEKTNVNIVVKEVADLQGNLMASPAVLDLYVYRNPLRWTEKHLNMTSHYGDEYSFTATFKNLSGKSKRYTIDSLPVWLTASETSSSIGALDENTITFTVSPYTNIGNYEEVISLVGEDGMTEPLPISLKVRGDVPDWAVDQKLLQTNISMSLIGQVTIDGNVARDSEDMLAAFNEEHRLLGVAHLTSSGSSNANDGLAYLNIYNNSYAEIPLYFEFYDASTGIIHNVKTMDGLTFTNDTVVGTTTAPIPFTNGDGVVQAIHMKKGWNWLSFNVEPSEDLTVKQLLNNATKWKVGDALEAERADGRLQLITYKAIANPRDPNSVRYVWDCADSIVTLDACKMYRLYSSDDKMGYVAGNSCYEGIKVKKGWNRIGFISNLNLPLGTAMAEYAEYGSAGDIIKSQSEFAVLTEDAAGGNKLWKGTLKYLRVGEGYMLKRNKDSEVEFYYPYYFSGSRYGGKAAPRRKPVFENTGATSMTVVAVADGVEVQTGDRLTAYRGAVVCGIAEADEQGQFYLSVGAHEDLDAKGEALTFTLERDGEVLAVTTRSQMNFVPDAALGTPDEPTAISFIATDNLDGDGWYTLSGIKLNKRPAKAGVYIHNNEKVTIK